MTGAKPKTPEILERARREIDLPAWLTERGWQEVPSQTASATRRFVGPAGRPITVTQIALGQSLEWRYYNPTTSKLGSIVDVVEKLLGITDPAEIVSLLSDALAAIPPSPSPKKVEKVWAQTPLSVGPLGQPGREYLLHELRLAESTVEAFAHRLRQTSSGAVRARHHRGGGEERGYGRRSFVRAMAAGDDDGPSLFVASPRPAKKCRFILVAESFESALSAWQKIPDVFRRLSTLIVSTAGDLTAAGIKKLCSLIARIWKSQSRDKYEPIYLVDAGSRNNQDLAEAREQTLRVVASDTGLTYHRYAPSQRAQNWSDALIAEKENGRQEVQPATARVATSAETILNAHRGHDVQRLADPTQEFGPTSSDAATSSPAKQPPRDLHPLSEAACHYLTREQHLDPRTVADFRGKLRSNADGHLVAPHNAEGDGEEPGPNNPNAFWGSEDDREGRGRSVWHAQPPYQKPVRMVAVAESVLEALSFAAELAEANPSMYEQTRIVSTAGILSGTGEAKLELLIRRAQREAMYRWDITLVDCSGVGKVRTAANEAALSNLAARVGAKYIRRVPEHGTDFNESLAVSEQSKVQESGEVQAEATTPCRSADAWDTKELENPERGQSISTGRGR